MQMPGQTDTRLWMFFVLGGLVAFGTSLLRARHSWWPFGPLGLALAGSWTLQVYWFPLLVMWLVKSAISRLVGVRAYVAWRPFFQGLILGEFAMAMIWAVIRFVWDLPVPYFPYN
jgi:hypothetical protein